MSKYSNLPSLPPTVEKAAATLQFASNIGFWLQLVLGVIAAVILLFAGASVLGGEGPSQGNSLGIFCAAVGVLSLVVSIISFFRCRKIARMMQTADAADRPKKSYTLQIINLGLTASLIGMAMCIIGAESLVGLLLGKLLNLPQGAAVYDTKQLPQPKEIIIILANTHTIASHFSGIVISLWLLNRLNKS